LIFSYSNQINELKESLNQKIKLAFLSYENGGKDILVGICRKIATQNNQLSSFKINSELIEKLMNGNNLK